MHIFLSVPIFLGLKVLEGTYYEKRKKSLINLCNKYKLLLKGMYYEQ